MPDDSLIKRLAEIYVGEEIGHPQLKPITLAQWLLESGRGSSDLAQLHYNFGGLKWRSVMTPFATPVLYGAHDGEDLYCKFATLEKFISGYWAFIGRSPYSGWETHVDTGADYIRFIGPIYTPSAGYAAKVIALEAEASALLAAAKKAGTASASAGPKDIGTIILDPGHGGTQKVGGSSPNNAVSISGVKEKKLTLDFCLILRDALLRIAAANGQKIQVILTRNSDVNVGIADRAGLALKHMAKALVCIHFNGLGDPKVRGTETFFAAKENGNTNLADDTAFATAVQDGLMAGMRSIDPAAKNRGVKPDTQTGLGVLGLLRDTALGNTGRTDKCVAAYVEAEFITNPAVESLLISGPNAIANRTVVMTALASAIVEQMAKLP